MMCPGLWTLDLGCDLPLDSRAFTLRFLVFLTHSLYPQLSSFCLRIAPFPSSSCTIRTTIHTRVRTLLAHYNYIYHEHDIHQLRTTSINFIRALLYSLLSFHVHFFLRFFLYFLRSSFINIISRPFLLHVHYRLNLSLVTRLVCLSLFCPVCLSVMHILPPLRPTSHLIQLHNIIFSHFVLSLICVCRLSVFIREKTEER